MNHKGLGVSLALILCLGPPLALAQSAAPLLSGHPPVQKPDNAYYTSIPELPSNQESGVDIDQFVGSPANAVSKIFNGLVTRSILRAGNPYAPGPAGAVLEYRDELSLATLEPHFETGLQSSAAITFYYVDEGVGRLDTGPGTKVFDLRKGVGVLIAPGVKQHFVNTGDAPLSMVMLTWTNNEVPKLKQDIKVVDGNTIPISSQRAHWVHAGKPMFSLQDGTNVIIQPILFPANSYGGPHAHPKSVEEIWVKVGSDTGYAILGSEIREMTGVAAFLAPPNGVTVHSSMNLNKQPQTWLYISRRKPVEAAAAK